MKIGFETSRNFVLLTTLGLMGAGVAKAQYNNNQPYNGQGPSCVASDANGHPITVNTPNSRCLGEDPYESAPTFLPTPLPPQPITVSVVSSGKKLVTRGAKSVTECLDAGIKATAKSHKPTETTCTNSQGTPRAIQTCEPTADKPNCTVRLIPYRRTDATAVKQPLP